MSTAAIHHPAGVPTKFVETCKCPGYRVVCYLPDTKNHNQTIANLATNTLFVKDDAHVEDLADDLVEHEEIQAVAVVDNEMRVHGVVVRRLLMATLARPYGRDVLRRRPVREQVEDIVTFHFGENVHTVNEALAAELEKDEVIWYALVDEKGAYRGLFSSRDMLLYSSSLSRSDLDMARHLQKKITGEVSSIHEMTFDLVASSRTAKGVGGDYYSVDKYDEDKWLISVCDVSGKGVAASLITSVIWGMMSIFDFRRGIKDFIQQVNRYLFRTFEAEKFVTGIFLDFHAADGTMSLCDMGHSYIFLYRNGRLRLLKTNSHNLPIGIRPDSDPIINRFQLRPNDLVLIPTDGLLEQEGYDGTCYTPDRIQRILNMTHGKPLDEIHNGLMEDFNQFRGDRHLHDDVTYVLLNFFDEPEDALL